ncbi:hypothetical protein EVAR_97583_1 [Eumeta japonica]|uniref:Uncharacterized protein n=1 Tax=Eumeta variegata TaxID=151549 RepID=A0A4C1WNP0_EUMVA|nr:hypothetical protein EVAR_97583_1 [Eumeta japonica]
MTQLQQILGQAANVGAFVSRRDVTNSNSAPRSVIFKESSTHLSTMTFKVLISASSRLIAAVRSESFDSRVYATGYPASLLPTDIQSVDDKWGPHAKSQIWAVLNQRVPPFSETSTAHLSARKRSVGG